jgi:phosphatidate cytidylyltransferase
LFNLDLPLGFQFLFASVIGLIGQIGDLAESKIKREFNVKDSSALLPGHGGVLDRFDSILFVYPTITLIIVLLAISG